MSLDACQGRRRREACHDRRRTAGALRRAPSPRVYSHRGTGFVLSLTCARDMRLKFTEASSHKQSARALIAIVFELDGAPLQI